MYYNQNLSPRENEITNLLTKGLSNKEIANELSISVHTVKAHLEDIFDKMNVKNRVQLAIKFVLDSKAIF